MLQRKCAGGIVFFDDTVLLLKNDKNEWVLPKGVIRDDKEAEHVALDRVRVEGGVDADVFARAGATSYEFYSTSRKQPVCNEIVWYLMTAPDQEFSINTEEGFVDGGFFPIEEAIEKITYSQDKSLLRAAAEKYRRLNAI